MHTNYSTITFADNQSIEDLWAENQHLRELVRHYEERSGHESGEFVGSSWSDHFHRPGCKWAQRIARGNLLKWSSHEAAVNAGRKPCKTCRA
jgi:hypothetical protein